MSVNAASTASRVRDQYFQPCSYLAIHAFPALLNGLQDKQKADDNSCQTGMGTLVCSIHDNEQKESCDDNFARKTATSLRDVGDRLQPGPSGRLQ